MCVWIPGSVDWRAPARQEPGVQDQGYVLAFIGRTSPSQGESPASITQPEGPLGTRK